MILHYQKVYTRPGATVRYSGALPPNHCLHPPNEKCAPPQAKIVSQRKHRLGATGVYFESGYHQINGHHPRIREQELFFRRCCDKDLFFIFSLHPRIRENYRIFRDEDLCFLPLCRPKNYLCPPFQPRYSGAAPALYQQWRKLERSKHKFKFLKNCVIHSHFLLRRINSNQLRYDITFRISSLGEFCKALNNEGSKDIEDIVAHYISVHVA